MTDLTAPLPRASARPVPAAPEWVVLADGSGPDSSRSAMPMRWTITLTVVAAVVMAAVVGLVGTLLARHSAENEAVHNVAQLTDVIATSVIQPALTDAMATSSREATRVLDPIVRDHVVNGSVNGSLVRVKLWNASGTVLYSDDPRLIGDRFPLDDDAREALSTPQTQAEISDLDRPENRLDRNRGKLLEVYRPVWTPDGTPLLFETYFTYDTVAARSSELWRGFGGIIATSIAALLLLLVPLVWALVSRTRRARAERVRAMEWALEASNEERRHIAATLHDGVVQQLAATSFAAAGEAQRATSAGDAELGARLNMLAGTVRDSISGMRSLLVDIYPPSLHTAGLAAALRDLARSTGSGSAAVEADVDDSVADALVGEAAESTFRVVQEALRNAARHSAASRVVITVRATQTDSPEVRVDDNGVGFDLADVRSTERSDHFGLRLMADGAAASGARLEVATAPGSGTHLRMTWPTA